MVVDVIGVGLALLLASAAAAQRAFLSTEDGAVIYADLCGKGVRDVVLAHGGKFNKESWSATAKDRPILKILHAAGARAS